MSDPINVTLQRLASTLETAWRTAFPLLPSIGVSLTKWEPQPATVDVDRTPFVWITQKTMRPTGADNGWPEDEIGLEVYALYLERDATGKQAPWEWLNEMYTVLRSTLLGNLVIGGVGLVVIREDEEIRPEIGERGAAITWALTATIARS